MKIDSKPDTPAIAGTPAVQAKTVRDTAAHTALSGTQRAAATPAGNQDTVDVSSAGAAISGMNSSADFDSAKVESIRQAIREGRFSVNAEKIADRLIADATALLGPRTH